MALIKFGDYAMCWGSAANIKNKITDSGRTVTSFSIQYGKDGDKALFQNCAAWNDISRKYLNRLDKGDRLIVVGRFVKDDFWSEKKGTDEYKLTVEWANVQEQFDSAEADEELDLNDI